MKKTDEATYELVLSKYTKKKGGFKTLHTVVVPETNDFSKIADILKMDKETLDILIDDPFDKLDEGKEKYVVTKIKDKLRKIL